MIFPSTQNFRLIVNFAINFQDNTWQSLGFIFLDILWKTRLLSILCKFSSRSNVRISSSYIAFLLCFTKTSLGFFKIEERLSMGMSIALFLCCYYIFNMKYPSTSKNFFIFLEAIMLDNGSKAKKRVAINTFVKELS